MVKPPVAAGHCKGARALGVPFYRELVAMAVTDGGWRGRGHVEGDQGLRLRVLGSRGEHGSLGAPIFMWRSIKDWYGGGRRAVRGAGHGAHISGRVGASWGRWWRGPSMW